MTDTKTLSATVERPDGFTVTVSITAPADWPDVNEYGEIAAMAACRADNIITRNHEYRTTRTSPNQKEDNA